jgi:hypothetical protein
MFVKASNGTSALMANLSNLTAWRPDGTIPSDEELKRIGYGSREPCTPQLLVIRATANLKIQLGGCGVYQAPQNLITMPT